MKNRESKFQTATAAILSLAIGLTIASGLRVNAAFGDSFDDVHETYRPWVDLFNYRMPLVLMYHNLSQTETTPETAHSEVPLERFRSQILWLKKRGYAFFKASELADAMIENRQLHDSCGGNKVALITLDDGYDGEFEGYKFMVSEQIKATFFVHTDSVKKTSQEVQVGNQHMDWSQLIEINNNPLFEVQSHTLTHPDLTALDATSLTQQLVESRREIQTRLHTTRTAFAYPMGRYDLHVINETRKYYDIAFGLGTPPSYLERKYEVPRMSMTKDLSVEAFQTKVLSYERNPWRHPAR